MEFLYKGNVVLNKNVVHNESNSKRDDNNNVFGLFADFN